MSRTATTMSCSAALTKESSKRMELPPLFEGRDTVKSKLDGGVKPENSSSFTLADLHPVFVQVQLLQKGQHFVS